MEAIETDKTSILVVDDNRSVCSVLKKILTRKGYDVRTVGRGEKAVTLAKNLDFRIALIDLKLPDIEGRKLMDRVAKIAPEMDIIVITGHASVETAVDTLTTRAVYYVTKPIDMDRLLEVIRKTLERQRLQKKKEDTLNHLRAKSNQLSDVVHTISHDLKASLQLIMSYADLAKAECDSPDIEAIAQLAGKITEMMDRSVKLADEGLVVKKTDQVNLKQVVMETASTMTTHDVEFRIGHLPVVKGDETKLGQVFLNLFRNAIEHAQPDHISVTMVNSDDEVDILVTNDGKPIPDEYRHNLFDRGISSKDSEGGLGLFIVRRVVEGHGWNIELADEPDTTFRITVPKNELVV
jgi:signal transduction histidine kinase